MLSKIIIFLIKIYQGIGHRPACRFIPSCSAYALVAIQKYGVAKGVYLAIRRVFRCRPGGQFGYDPVP